MDRLGTGIRGQHIGHHIRVHIDQLQSGRHRTRGEKGHRIQTRLFQTVDIIEGGIDHVRTVGMDEQIVDRSGRPEITRNLDPRQATIGRLVNLAVVASHIHHRRVGLGNRDTLEV